LNDVDGQLVSLTINIAALPGTALSSACIRNIDHLGLVDVAALEPAPLRFGLRKW